MSASQKLQATQHGESIFLSKHRIEALTDGIFAVAMTLLVIELKLPDVASVKAQGGLNVVLLHMLPRLFAWIVSFYVLAIFWISHHRVFHYVQHVNKRILGVNMLMLALASLMPFSSSLIGEHGYSFTSQCIYAGNMALLAATSIWKTALIYQHSQSSSTPMPKNIYSAGRVRALGLIAVSVVTMVIAWFTPPIASAAFALMFFVRRFGDSAERHM
jgi:uncharacterized membrane protein